MARKGPRPELARPRPKPPLRHRAFFWRRSWGGSPWWPAEAAPGFGRPEPFSPNVSALVLPRPGAPERHGCLCHPRHGAAPGVLCCSTAKALSRGPHKPAGGGRPFALGAAAQRQYAGVPPCSADTLLRAPAGVTLRVTVPRQGPWRHFSNPGCRSGSKVPADMQTGRTGAATPEDRRRFCPRRGPARTRCG